MTRWQVEDDGIIEDMVSLHLRRNAFPDKPIIRLKNILMSHNLKMLGGFAIVFIIGGLQAFKIETVPFAPYIDSIVSILLFIEHSLNGNS